MTVPAKGFISYAHDDFDLFEEFRTHIRATERRWGTAFWADPAINAGYHWNAEIEQKIAEADLFVLLVSAEFIASDYICDKEIPAIESRCAAVKGLILPVVLRRCAWGYLTSAIQAVPMEKGKLKPIVTWHRHNDGFDCAREQIDSAISHHYGVPLPSRPWVRP